MTSKREIIIVGCGVVGLSSGIKLLEQYPVKIIAQQLPPHTTSDVAAAFWKPSRIMRQERLKKWSADSLDEFYSLANAHEGGVSITSLVHLLGIDEEEPWWLPLLRKSRPAKKEELPAGFVRGNVVEVPKIETPVYMPYLMNRFKKLGGAVEKTEKPLDLVELSSENRIIVNCTGIGARDFCSDIEIFPIRGQIVRVSAVGLESIFDYDVKPTYIVPRANDCILGGTAQENNWSLAPDPQDAEDILASCRQLLPALSEVKILGHKVGLRPGRNEVRLESEQISPTCTVIHNYGHGRAGVTLSWGCAQAVFDLVSIAIEKDI